MIYRRFQSGWGHFFGMWPVLLLLLLVLLPTACLLWFMNEAIENQRAAVRQGLTDAYSSQLAMMRERLADYWDRKTRALDEIGQTSLGPAAFASCVGKGLADSVICYDKRGRPVYPAGPQPADSNAGERHGAWEKANGLEHVQRDPKAAAVVYQTIAEEAPDPTEIAQALVAQARCLVQAGQAEAAVRILTETIGQDRYRQAVDSQGRLIAADAAFRALELMNGPDHPGSTAVVKQLEQRLTDYDDPTLAGTQRRFLMKQTQTLAPAAEFPTLPAEDLAGRFLEADQSPPAGSILLPTPVSGVWQFALPSGRVRALFRTETLLSNIHDAVAATPLPSGVVFRLVHPEEGQTQDGCFVSAPAGDRWPGWTLAIVFQKTGVLDEAAGAQTAVYFWTGLLSIASVAVLAVLIAGAFRRQMRLTRLRNDLVATVSHELKTPLSSIRLLVDTLLDAKELEEKTVREYLQLVARENTRLSRLIDNFLAFSRMERNKHAFEFTPTHPAEIVHAAVEAAGERFRASGCQLDVRIDDASPPIMADTDAMVTAILNLLDNAHKYSSENKQISLCVRHDNDSVRFKVQDNGIGLSRAASKRVFRRFYQVDQRLSRQGGGCGLGLSIVQFIVNAHGGNVSVQSKLGQGSTFTVTIPCA